MSSLLGLIKGAYSSLPEINAATLSGAIDIVVVEQEDGSLLSSPFHVRFGRWKVLRNPRDRAVKITVNEQLVDFVMKLGSTGQAYFVEETDEPPPEEEATSPILSPQALQPLGSGDPADIPTFRLDGEVGDDRCVSPTSDEEPESGEGAAVPKAPSSASSWWRFGGTGAKKRREDAAGDDVFLEELLLEQMKTEKEEMELEMAQLAASEANGEVGEDGDQDEEFLGLGDRLHHSADYEGGAPGNGLSMNRPASRLTLLQSDDVLPGEEEEEGAGGVFHAARRRSVELLVDDGEASPQFLHVSPSKELFGSGGGAGTNGAVLEGEGGGGGKTLDLGGVEVPPLLQRSISEVDEDAEENAVDLRSRAPVSREVLLELLQQQVAASNEGEGVVSPGSAGEPGKGAPRLRLSLCGRFLQQHEMTLKEQRAAFNAHLVTVEAFHANPLDIASNPELFVDIDGDMYRWQIMAPALLSAIAFGRPLPLQVHQQLCSLDSRFSLFQPDRRAVSVDDEDEDDKDFSYTLLRRIGSEEDDDPDEEDQTPSGAEGRNRKKYERKTMHPAPEQLSSLPLKPGANTICFYISHKASSPPVTASIFLWSYKSKVVISDVDGTITKSDVMGHLLPRVGIQWAQKGVPQLLQAITNNDYKVLYLTARPIGQVDTTKTYLRSVTEDGVHLPLGPVITSPDGVFKSINREIIQRKPEEFKIECLNNLRNLFPKELSPFYAGFGNRPNDTISYRAVAIPDTRILIINPAGAIHNPLNNSLVSSYDGLRELVDLMFPPVVEERDEPTSEEFNATTFWRSSPLAMLPPPEP